MAGGYNGQLGSKLEAQDLPKSRPKPEKIDVKKQHVFGIEFLRVRTSFWEARNLKNSNFASTGARFFKNRGFQKNSDFGRVLGGVWGTKILDFRSLFDVFSMQNFDCNLER